MLNSSASRLSWRMSHWIDSLKDVNKSLNRWIKCITQKLWLIWEGNKWPHLWINHRIISETLDRKTNDLIYLGKNKGQSLMTDTESFIWFIQNVDLLNVNQQLPLRMRHWFIHFTSLFKAYIHLETYQVITVMISYWHVQMIYSKTQIHANHTIYAHTTAH